MRLRISENSLASLSSLAPTGVPQTVHRYSYLFPVGSTSRRWRRTGRAARQRGQYSSETSNWSNCGRFAIVITLSGGRVGVKGTGVRAPRRPLGPDPCNASRWDKMPRAVRRDRAGATSRSATVREGRAVTNLVFTALVAAGSLAAGVLGSLTGLGGGVVIVPLLALAFGVDIRYAIGASLVAVIATSSGAAAAFVREGFSNIRIAMFLEIATTLGALAGASLAVVLSPSAIAVVFGLVLVYSAFLSGRPGAEPPPAAEADRLATRLRLDGALPGPDGARPYRVQRVPLGFGLMALAGGLSGLLGIGSGAVKVLAMDQAMRIPFKVSTTTSNFMIGVTAAASAGVYLDRGYIDPALAMPVVLGVLAGSTAGARVLVGARTDVLRRVFAAAILVLAAEMIYNGFTGRL